MKLRPSSVLFAFIALGALTAHAAPAKKPNFLVIVADDLGYADLGFQGSRQIKTPNLDRLAAASVVFGQGYSSSSVCSPSRAGLLTGRYQNRFGFEDNLTTKEVYPGYDGDAMGLPPEQKTIADRLDACGYKTGLIGKWHLGDLPQYHPAKRGFTEFWGFLGGGRDYFAKPSTDAKPETKIGCNYKTPTPITYITDDIGDECADFVKRHADEPFCLFAMFNAPHAPMQATEADMKPYAGIPDKRRRTYCGMVAALDRNVGKILDTLETKGLADDTVVVFLSDNGGPPTSNGSCNAPLNGSKGCTWEGGIRVPFVIRWPGHLKPRTYAYPVISLDLTPTFLALAGGEVKPEDQLDGVDLMPFLTGKNIGRPHRLLAWKFSLSAAIRDGDMKLVRPSDRLPMVYNLTEDVSEQHDLMTQNIGLTQTLLKELSDWEGRNPFPRFPANRAYHKHDLELFDLQYRLTQPGPDEVPRVTHPKPADTKDGAE